jgi:hypothetical protein
MSSLLGFDDWVEAINESSEVALKNKAKASKIPLGILRQVYNKGMAAWKTGHRPGVSQQQWAMARVNSFIMGGKTTKMADKSLWERAKKAKKAKRK